jgi:hypothetical protein
VHSAHGYQLAAENQKQQNQTEPDKDLEAVEASEPDIQAENHFLNQV